MERIVPYRAPRIVRKVTVTSLREHVWVVSMDITETTVLYRAPRTVRKVTVTALREHVWLVSMDIRGQHVMKVNVFINSILLL